MNKELIKKYFAEFNHWVINDGELLFGKRNLCTNRIKWYPSVQSPFEETSDTAIIVINDEYVDLRKALIEGKPLQIWDTIDNQWRTSQSLTPSSKFTQPIGDYRIKPTIKVGDWVENSEGFIFPATPENIHAISDFKPWKPRVGEWCIVDNSINKSDPTSFTVHKWQSNSTWKPIPYTGPIPYFIKD